MGQNHAIFDPANTLQASRYSVVPFQKVQIPLNNVNRTNGEEFPQFEGDAIRFNRVDYPCIVSLVSTSTGAQQTFVAFPGLTIEGPFKKLTVSHPLFTINTINFVLEFTIGKGSASSVNQESNPYVGFFPPYLILSDTALVGSISVPIPPGCRYISKVSFLTTATAVTNSRWRMFNAIGVAIGFPAYGGFTTAGLAQGALIATQIGASLGLFEATDIPVPSDAVSLQLDTTGTGLAIATVGALKVLYQG